MTSKSKTYAFRLHPDDEREQIAMEIIERLLSEDWTMRQIMTDAILHADGRTPEMFRGIDDTMTKGYLETQLSDIANHIISELRANGMVMPSEKQGKESPFGKDEDEEMAQNLANGYLARRKRGNQ
jgi:hypothetical protein